MGDWDTAAVQQAGNILQVGMQNQSNKRAFKRSADFTREMFDATNEYNHPVQQMARLKEAGLNPALMYGKSGGTGQATSPPGQTQTPTQIPDLNAGLSYAQLQLMKSQQENADSQTNLNTLQGATEAEKTALVKQQTAKTGAEAVTAGETAKLASELTNAQLQAQLIGIKGKEEGILQTKAQTANIKQSTKKTKAETKRLTATQKTFIDQERAKLYKFKEDIKLERLQQDSEYAKRIGIELDNMIKTVKADAAQQGIAMESVSQIFGSLLQMVGKIDINTGLGKKPYWMSQYVYDEIVKYKKSK